MHKSASQTCEDFLERVHVTSGLSSAETEEYISDFRKIIEAHPNFSIGKREIEEIANAMRLAFKTNPNSKHHIIKTFLDVATLGDPIEPLSEELQVLLKQARELGAAQGEELLVERTTKIDQTTARLHPHFSADVIENFGQSTFWERGARVLSVGAGAMLIGKAFTYDRHQDQEGKKPHPLIFYIDLLGGTMLGAAGLFIRAKAGSPMRSAERMFERL